MWKLLWCSLYTVPGLLRTTGRDWNTQGGGEKTSKPHIQKCGVVNTNLDSFQKGSKLTEPFKKKKRTFPIMT